MPTLLAFFGRTASTTAKAANNSPPVAANSNDTPPAECQRTSPTTSSDRKRKFASPDTSKTPRTPFSELSEDGEPLARVMFQDVPSKQVESPEQKDDTKQVPAMQASPQSELATPITPNEDALNTGSLLTGKNDTEGDEEKVLVVEGQGVSSNTESLVDLTIEFMNDLKTPRVVNSDVDGNVLSAKTPNVVSELPSPQAAASTPESVSTTKRRPTTGVRSTPLVIDENFISITLVTISDEIESLRQHFQQESSRTLNPSTCFSENCARNKDELLKRVVLRLAEGSPLSLSALSTEISSLAAQLYATHQQDPPPSSLAEEGHQASLSVAVVRNLLVSHAERKDFGAAPAHQVQDILEDTDPQHVWRWQVRDEKMLGENNSEGREAALEARKRREKVQLRLKALHSTLQPLQGGDAGAIRAAMTALQKVDTLSRINTMLAEARARKAANRDKQREKEAGKLAEAKRKKEEKEALKEKERQEKEAEKKRVQEEKEAERRRVQEEKDRQKEELRLEREAKLKEQQEERQRVTLERMEKQAEKDREANKKAATLQKSQNLMAMFVKKAAPPPTPDTSTVDPVAGASSTFASKAATEAMDRILLGQTSPCLEKDGPYSQEEGKKEGKGGASAEDSPEHPQGEEGGAALPAAPPSLMEYVSSWQSAKRKRCQIQDSVGSISLPLDREGGIRRRWGCRRTAKRQKVEATKAEEMEEVEVIDLLASEGAEGESLVAEVEETAGLVGTVFGGSPGKRRLSRMMRRKLLQFHQDLRPAFYGTWPPGVPRESTVVRGRKPFKKEPTLDYTVDSADEWEEEEEGESLSGTEDNDEEEVKGSGGPGGEDAEEEGDGFMVPDGYLSEEERGLPEDMEEDELEEGEGAASGEGVKTQQSVRDPDHLKMLRTHKYLATVSEQAKRAGKPVLVSTLQSHSTSVEGEEGGKERRPATLTADCLDTSKYVCGSVQLLQMCSVVFPKAGLSVGCVSPPEDKKAESQGGPIKRAGKDSKEGGGGEEAAGGKTKKSHHASKAVFPPDLLAHLVKFLLQNPSQINKVTDDFTTVHLKDGLQRKAVWKEVKRIAEYLNRKWQIRPEVLAEVNITDPDSLRPKDVPKKPKIAKVKSGFEAGVTQISPTSPTPPTDATLTSSEPPPPLKATLVKFFGKVSQASAPPTTSAPPSSSAPSTSSAPPQKKRITLAPINPLTDTKTPLELLKPDPCRPSTPPPAPEVIPYASIRSSGDEYWVGLLARIGEPSASSTSAPNNSNQTLDSPSPSPSPLLNPVASPLQCEIQTTFAPSTMLAHPGLARSVPSQVAYALLKSLAHSHLPPAFRTACATAVLNLLNALSANPQTADDKRLSDSVPSDSAQGNQPMQPSFTPPSSPKPSAALSAKAVIPDKEEPLTTTGLGKESRQLAAPVVATWQEVVACADLGDALISALDTAQSYAPLATAALQLAESVLRLASRVEEGNRAVICSTPAGVASTREKLAGPDGVQLLVIHLKESLCSAPCAAVISLLMRHSRTCHNLHTYDRFYWVMLLDAVLNTLKEKEDCAKGRRLCLLKSLAAMTCSTAHCHLIASEDDRRDQWLQVLISSLNQDSDAENEKVALECVRNLVLNKVCQQCPEMVKIKASLQLKSQTGGVSNVHELALHLLNLMVSQESGTTHSTEEPIAMLPNFIAG